MSYLLRKVHRSFDRANVWETPRKQGCGRSGSAALPASAIEVFVLLPLRPKDGKSLSLKAVLLLAIFATDLEDSRSLALQSGKLSNYIFNAIEPPFALNRCWTRSALKKRNSIGESGDPCGSPACSNCCWLEVWLLTKQVVMGEGLFKERCIVAGKKSSKDKDKIEDGDRLDVKEYYILVVRPTSMDGEYKRVGVGMIQSDYVVRQRFNVRVM